MASFEDGTSNTYIAGEVVPEYNAFLAWALGNGVVRHSNAPLNYVKSTYDPSDPLPVTFSDWPNHSFISRHPGGVQFVYADGHVSFLSESIDRTVYWGLGTRDGGEVIPGGTP